MDVNISKLQKELIASGIEFGGINANGVVWDTDGITEIQSRPDVAALIAAHDPSLAASLSPSQQIILADGIDVANVTITGEPGAAVDYTVNGVPFQATLDASGTEYIELDCDTPNTTLVVLAGTARAVVYAVEVPA